MLQVTRKLGVAILILLLPFLYFLSSVQCLALFESDYNVLKGIK